MDKRSNLVMDSVVQVGGQKRQKMGPPMMNPLGGMSIQLPTPQLAQPGGAPIDIPKPPSENPSRRKDGVRFELMNDRIDYLKHKFVEFYNKKRNKNNESVKQIPFFYPAREGVQHRIPDLKLYCEMGVCMWDPAASFPAYVPYFACPKTGCDGKMDSKGWGIPRRVRGIVRSEILVARRLKCMKCGKNASACNEVIIKNLPTIVQRAFPYVLTRRLAITKTFQQLIQPPMKAQPAAAISGWAASARKLIARLTKAHYNLKKSMWDAHTRIVVDGKREKFAKFAEFPALSDPDGYNEIIPSVTYIQSLMVGQEEEIRNELVHVNMSTLVPQTHSVPPPPPQRMPLMSKGATTMAPDGVPVANKDLPFTQEEEKLMLDIRDKWDELVTWKSAADAWKRCIIARRDGSGYMALPEYTRSADNLKEKWKMLKKQGKHMP